MDTQPETLTAYWPLNEYLPAVPVALYKKESRLQWWRLLSLVQSPLGALRSDIEKLQQRRAETHRTRSRADRCHSGLRFGTAMLTGQNEDSL